MSVTEGQKDQILNAINMGMAYDDALIMCGMTMDDVEALKNDVLFQSKAQMQLRAREHRLLQNLNDVIDVQVAKGKDHAVIWALGKTNPRYADKPLIDDTKGATINIITQGRDVGAQDTVEVYNPVKKAPVEAVIDPDNLTPPGVEG